MAGACTQPRMAASICRVAERKRGKAAVLETGLNSASTEPAAFGRLTCSFIICFLVPVACEQCLPDPRLALTATDRCLLSTLHAVLRLVPIAHCNKL
jgi:hypothetical protein